MHVSKRYNLSEGPTTNLHSALCILTETLPPAHAEGQKSLNGFESGTFVASFPSDGAASMLVKGLTWLSSECSRSVPPTHHSDCLYIRVSRTA